MAGRKRNPSPPPAGDNSMPDQETLTLIAKLTKEVREFENERKAVNESIGERRAAIKALGIDMDAWKASKRRKEMDPDDRDNFDQSAAICNAALGVSIQPDLFGSEPKQGGGAVTSSLPTGLH